MDIETPSGRKFEFLWSRPVDCFSRFSKHAEQLRKVASRHNLTQTKLLLNTSHLGVSYCVKVPYLFSAAGVHAKAT